MTSPEFDLLIKNVRVVRPHGNVVHDSDIAIRDGRFALVAPGIDVARAKKVHDGRSRLAFPGVVDAHLHSGIYSPLIEDAVDFEAGRQGRDVRGAEVEVAADRRRHVAHLGVLVAQHVPRIADCQRLTCDKLELLL